jgi:hypothetical protein
MREASSIPLLRISRSALHAGVAALLIMAACSLGGCAGNSGGPSNAMAMAPASDGPTIAFDQIDGPPPQVFDRMVDVLDSESKMRSLAIVSRDGPAAYRVRGYLSAQVVSGKTVIAWVWDVYDSNQQRALRLSGQEQVGRTETRDPWAAADDLVLRKIAQAGFSGLSGMITGTAPADGAPQPGPAPAARGPAIATAAPSPAPTARTAEDTSSTSVAALGYTDR